MVGRRSVAAVSGVRAGNADAVQEVLHGVAPAVAAACGDDATDMALVAARRGLQLDATVGADHMPHLALRFNFQRTCFKKCCIRIEHKKIYRNVSVCVPGRWEA